MREEFLKNYHRNSAGQSPASWVLCPCYTIFSWTQRYGHSPEPFREHSVDNQEPSGDHSQNDLYPEVEFFTCRVSNPTDANPDEASHMVTGVQEDIPYCSPGTSSGIQKKVRSKSQLQFGSEKILATIGAEKILLALQQLASKSNSANFINIINRISKLLKSPKRTMPFYDGKLENFELFADLFQTS